MSTLKHEQYRYSIFVLLFLACCVSAWLIWQYRSENSVIAPQLETGDASGVADTVSAAQYRQMQTISDTMGVFESWDTDELRPLLSSTTEQGAAADLEEVFAVLSDELGELRSFTTPHLVPAANPPYLTYEVDASFENSPALITFLLEQEGEEYAIYSLNIKVLTNNFPNTGIAYHENFAQTY